MTPESPSEVLELTVALDYGQFYLIGLPVLQQSSEALTELVQTAIKGVGISSSRRTRSWSSSPLTRTTSPCA